MDVRIAKPFVFIDSLALLTGKELPEEATCKDCLQVRQAANQDPFLNRPAGDNQPEGN